MKINEFAIVEPKVDEAPQGILKRTGLGIAKAFGSDKAAGKLETGKMANLIKKAFMKHLGASGREMNAEELIKFLKMNKYPTQGVEKLAQDMANKEKAKTMQKGPLAGKDNQQAGDDDNIIQMPSQSDIKQFGQGESVEEAELKGSQLDKLIMKAATDAYDTKAGYSGTGLDSLTGGGQQGSSAGGQQGGDDKNTKKALQRLKSDFGIENINMARDALNRLSNGEQVTKQQRDAVRPLISTLVNSFDDATSINKLLQLGKSVNKS
jgi:hypothetical protein